LKLSYQCDNQTANLDANVTAEQIEGAWSVIQPDGVTTRNVDVKLARVTTGADGTVSFDLYETNSTAPKRCSIPVAHTERGIEVSYLGQTYVFTERSNQSSSKGKGPTGSGSLIAPMVGVLSEIFVAEGDTVAQYQPLAIVEAMKVMATIEAPFAGIVKKLYAVKGAQLTHGQLIVEIVPLETK
jgi:biotin carboxyl carrier protein